MKKTNQRSMKKHQDESSSSSKKDEVKSSYHFLSICCSIIVFILFTLSWLIPLMINLNLSPSTSSSSSFSPSSTFPSLSNSTMISTTTTTSLTTTASPTTTTSRTTTTTSMSCSSSGFGLTLLLLGSNPTSWTKYSFNMTSTTNSMKIVFGFQNENNRFYYLDDVSVIDSSSPSQELLINPSFENSSSIPLGWIQTCSSTCSGRSGSIVSGSQCYLAGGNCFEDGCLASTGIEFLSQTISTTIGNLYSISFRLILSGSGVTAANRFYFDLF